MKSQPVSWKLAKSAALLCSLLSIAGCTAYGRIQNLPITKVEEGIGTYSVDAFNDKLSNHDNVIILALSGGGTRAAALAYGVMSELKDTQVNDSGGQHPLLADVGIISSVSGGSFTAAYYGLFGNRLFDDFETRFLKKDISRGLLKTIFAPSRWFSTMDRTEYAIQYYDKEIFDGLTYGDMLRRKDAPMILINATDLTKGVRFSFMQEYFNLLCSDLSSFPVSRAVAASSAVPILFSPVVVENHNGCSTRRPQWLENARARSDDDPELALTVEGIESYYDKRNHQYAHFVDGGITDNLGLRAIFDISSLIGDAKAMFNYFNISVSSRLTIISVDASAKPDYDIGRLRHPPTTLSTINAMTDIQLHRYNTATVTEMQRATERLVAELSDDGDKDIKTHFIRVSFDDLMDQDTREAVNQIPTTFSLPAEQVDLLIKSGRQLLKDNPEYQNLLLQLSEPVTQ